MKSLLLFGIAVLSLSTARAQEPLIQPELKTYLKARVDQGFNPGISMAYSEGDKVVFYNEGQTQLQDGKPVDEHTVYEIGSISKVFTGILLAHEVVKGRMKLDDPIAKYLPESVTVPTRNGKAITLKDLATHSSGLPRLPDNMKPADMNNPYADYTVAQLYDFLSGYQLTRDIGSAYEYSNLGMGLLGHILALHTHRSYEELMLETIAEPLGMDETAITLSPKMKAHLATGHDPLVEPTSNWELPTLAGAGAIRSTASDMLKFLKANQTDDGSDLYKAMALSHTLAFSDTTQNVKVALAWHYSDNDRIISHSGGTGGYRAFAGFLKEGDKAVVLLTNSVFGLDGVGLHQLGQEIELTMPEKRIVPETVQLATELLEEYVGTYLLAPTFRISIMRRDDQMFGQGTGQPEFEIFASEKDQFFVKAVEASVTFNRDENGKVISLTLHQNGQDMPGLKVE